jgi:pimeloyl-ACP methyl ester carboxylesterase
MMSRSVVNDVGIEVNAVDSSSFMVQSSAICPVSGGAAGVPCGYSRYGGSGRLTSMPTRRQFLTAGGALVAVGVGGAIEMGGHRRTSILHRFGLANSPDRSVPPSHTPVVSGTLQSAHMSGPAKWSMSVPAGVLTGVVYCLHGHGEDHRFAFDQIHLPDFAAAGGANIAIAAVDGGTDSYWHRRADGDDPLAMLLDDFITLVESRVGVRPRALLGWSMGGYGALLAAETAPSRFRAVCAASPALWTSPGSTAEGAFDSADDYRRHDVYAHAARLDALTVRVDCGTGDPFFSAVKKFVEGLHPAPQGTFGSGFHDDAYWRSVAPAQIRTITRALERAQ